MSEHNGALPLTNFRQSTSVAALAAALAKAQGVIEGAKKDTEGQVGTAKKKYADLASVWAACKAALTANGLAVVQVPAATADAAGVDTLLCHASGEWVAGTLLLPVQRRDAQGMGSAITYARRYALMAFVGVAPEDDDADAAVGPQRQPRAAAQPAKPAPQPAVPILPTGPEFENRMFAYDAKLAAEGLCQPGALVKGVMAAGNAAGHAGPFASWNRAGVELAAKVTRDQEVAWREAAARGDAPGDEPPAAQPAPTAADPRDDLIRTIDVRLRGANRSWQGALLAEVGAGQLSGFLEPENVGQALGIVKVHASLEQLQRIAAGLEPKAAAKAPAKRKTA